MCNPEKIDKIEQKIELISNRFLSIVTFMNDEWGRTAFMDINEIECIMLKISNLEINLKSGHYHFINFQDQEHANISYSQLTNILIEKENSTSEPAKNSIHEEEEEENIDDITFRSEIKTDLPYYMLSCEKCKRTDPILFSTYFREGTRHFVKCRYCPNKTGYNFDPLDSVHEWNSRK